MNCPQCNVKPGQLHDIECSNSVPDKSWIPPPDHKLKKLMAILERREAELSKMRAGLPYSALMIWQTMRESETLLKDWAP